jgi:hypothetical protein
MISALVQAPGAAIPGGRASWPLARPTLALREAYGFGSGRVPQVDYGYP